MKVAKRPGFIWKKGKKNGRWSVEEWRRLVSCAAVDEIIVADEDGMVCVHAKKADEKQIPETQDSNETRRDDERKQWNQSEKRKSRGETR